MKTYLNWYIEVIKKYAVFTGRATRTEYWSFFFVSLVVSILLGILNVDIISNLYSLAILLPGIGVAIRRLHDINRSGWWLLISLIPIVGWIVIIVFLVKESDVDNKYGPKPVSNLPTDSTSEPITASPVETQATSVVEETKIENEEVVINDMPESSSAVVESHESLEEKN